MGEHNLTVVISKKIKEKFVQRTKKKFAKELLAWYDQNARILPWRESQEPYNIWVSEIMLQQTQVQTVLPYFERFIQVFPDFKALAYAEEAQLLKLWEGLGYYNRVRNMQRTARILMDQYDGKLPADYGLLLKLPGIGTYTAGAIISIAFNKPAAAVDGNVLRVFSRITGSLEDVGNSIIKKKFQNLALKLQSKNRPGDFNQALMELGATLCLPKAAPLCTICPLIKLCKAYRDKTTAEIPVKIMKKKRKIEMRSVLIIKTKDQALLRQRSGKGLLAGLWEPLNMEGWTSEEGVLEVLEELGLEAISISRIEQAKHLFTHIEWRLQGYLIEVLRSTEQEGFIWAGHEAIEDELAIPFAFKAYKKYLPKGSSYVKI